VCLCVLLLRHGVLGVGFFRRGFRRLDFRLHTTQLLAERLEALPQVADASVGGLRSFCRIGQTSGGPLGLMARLDKPAFGFNPSLALSLFGCLALGGLALLFRLLGRAALVLVLLVICGAALVSVGLLRRHGGGSPLALGAPLAGGVQVDRRGRRPARR
jgi:hypothetical protein